MVLICEPITIGIASDISDEKIHDALNQFFLRRSDYKYGWLTKSITREPNAIKSTATQWDDNVKQNFIGLVSDVDRLCKMDLNTEETTELAIAANALDDIHNFCGFYHMIDDADASFHTLIHPLTLSQIQAHPENYLLIMGETVIRC